MQKQKNNRNLVDKIQPSETLSAAKTYSSIKHVLDYEKHSPHYRTFLTSTFVSFEITLASFSFAVQKNHELQTEEERLNKKTGAKIACNYFN